ASAAAAVRARRRPPACADNMQSGARARSPCAAVPADPQRLPGVSTLNRAAPQAGYAMGGIRGRTRQVVRVGVCLAGSDRASRSRAAAAPDRDAAGVVVYGARM